MDAAKHEIMSIFLMKDLDPIAHYLGICVKRDREAGTIYFTQTAVINLIFKKTEITNYSFY